MDEKLRFVIDLQNKASAELKKLSKDFDGVKPTAGMRNTASWFQTLEGASNASTKAMRPLVGGLDMVGAGGLAAGLSVAGLVQQFKDLARALPALQELSRQSGISKTELSRLQYAASKLHVDPSKMTAAIGSWSAGMVQFSKQTGEVYAEMQNGSAGLAQKMVKEYGTDPVAALKDQIKWLAAIPEAQMRAGKSAQEAAQIQKYWVGKSLGDEGMAQFFGKGMDGITSALDEAAKRVHPVTDELEAAAENFDDSITNFNQTWSNFKNDVGPSFLNPLAAALDKLDGAMNLAAKYPGDAAAVAGTIAAAVVALRYQRRIMAGSKIAGVGGLDRAAGELTGAAGALKGAAAALESARGVPSAGIPPGGEPGKPASTSFDSGRALLAAAGLAGVVANSPGMDAAGDRERDANAAALEGFGETLRKWTGAEWLQGKVDAWRSAGASPAAAGTFHVPSRYDAEVRARRPNDLDGFVVGALGKEVIHLTGTLKTVNRAGESAIRPAAFHGAGFNGLSAGLDPESTIAAGTRRGFVDAFREIQGLQDLDRKGSGIMPASFGGGGTSPAATGRAPSLRYGRQHSSAPYDDGGATPTGAHDPLKDLIAQHETGGTGAAGYDTAYGHAERGGPLAPPKPLTQMTIAEVLAYQRAMKPRAGSPAFPVGRAQWTESTLRGLTRGMDPNTIFSPEVQEKLFDRSIAGRMGQGPTGFRSEWDSLRAVPDGEIERATQGHREALQNAAPTASAGPRGSYPGWMDDKSRREMAGINSSLARDLIAASEETGAHFRILQGLRTGAEAEANARRGVGVRNSQHLYGAAADLKLTGPDGRDLDRNDPAYERYATAFERISRAHGGAGRWLGHVPGWAWDRAHFDQGIGYGQSHARDPYGAGGPTAADVAAGNKEVFSGPDNPFLRAAKPLGDAADKLKAAVAPMPEVKPEPPRIDATAGQRAALDPIELNIRHHRDGRTSIAAKHGEGVKVSLQTAPTMTRVV